MTCCVEEYRRRKVFQIKNLTTCLPVFLSSLIIRENSCPSASKILLSSEPSVANVTHAFAKKLPIMLKNNLLSWKMTNPASKRPKMQNSAQFDTLYFPKIRLHNPQTRIQTTIEKIRNGKIKKAFPCIGRLFRYFFSGVLGQKILSIELNTPQWRAVKFVVL